MPKWLDRLLAAPTCAGCGRELVEWTDHYTTNGYRVERRWFGCPNARDRVGVYDEHQANWRRGRATPLTDHGAALSPELKP